MHDDTFLVSWDVDITKLIWEGSNDLSYQFIIRFEPKFWVNEENVKSFLELLHEIIFDHLDFHIGWKHVIELILC